MSPVKNSKKKKNNIIMLYYYYEDRADKPTVLHLVVAQ